MPKPPRTKPAVFFDLKMTDRHKMTLRNGRVIWILLPILLLIGVGIFWLPSTDLVGSQLANSQVANGDGNQLDSNTVLSSNSPLTHQVSTDPQPGEKKPFNANLAGTARPLTVSTLKAKEVDSFERLQRFTGVVVASQRTQLAFERAGRLLSILVDEGDNVQQGQPLAELDRRHLTASRNESAARLEEAKALLEELIAGPRQETIAAAEAEVRSFGAQTDSAERILNRRRQLVDTQAISEEEYEESLYDFRQMEAREQVSQRTLDELLAGTRKEQILAQQARVNQLAASLANIDFDLQDATLVAPFDGIVASRSKDAGAIMAAGEGLLELIDSSPPELWVGLPYRTAKQLELGESLTVEIDKALYNAVVKSLRTEVDSKTRTQNVVLKMEPTEAHPLPVPGQVGRIALTNVVQERGYWVPTNSLTPQKRGLWGVNIAVGKDATRTVSTRTVEVLYTDGERSFVRGTLQTGDDIIESGNHRIVEGQLVTPSQSELSWPTGRSDDSSMKPMPALSSFRVEGALS